MPGKFNALPTLEFRECICEAVDQNQVVVLTAETGAGKSTQVPQYLAEHGYDRVVVTQPRILAARNLTRRVREEWAERNVEDSSEIVGYRTAHERDDSGRTKVLYCTDGLQLVRELTGSGIVGRQVLVLDEVHEWNENMEVLVAWAKRRTLEDPGFKVVVMSATLDDKALAEYFSTQAIINVPGRHFEVSKRRGSDVIDELLRQLDRPQHNILTFLPGKSEIQNVLEAIEEKANKAGVPIIPLHSQLEAEMQQRAFASYPKGKIILSTNIAQTSVTIDDIDMVIDSGLVRQSEVRDGVEGLFIAQTSRADCAQRAGRAGRTKPGEYVLAPYDTMPCLPLEERVDYPVPEIMRTHIDRLTLRLASIGIDIETLDFYHDPSRTAIKRAKATLRSLGALTPGGEITNIGRAMERFPVESSYGRMLVAAEKYPPEVQSKLATIIAIQEVGGIVRGGASYIGWQQYVKTKGSDMLAQYDVLLSLPSIPEDLYEPTGIIAKNVDKAYEVIERLHRDLGLEQGEMTAIGDDEAGLLMKAIVAGQVNQLWAANEKGFFRHISTNQERELSSSSVVRGARLVAGTPFDLEVPLRGGDLETLHLLQNVTAVDVEWLIEFAPEQFGSRKSEIFYDPRLGGLARRQRVRFGKMVLEGRVEPVVDSSPEFVRRFNDAFSDWAFRRIDHDLRILSRYYRSVPSITRAQVLHHVKSRGFEVTNLQQLSAEDKRKLLAAAEAETYLGEDFRSELEYGAARKRQASPHTGRRRGFIARHKRKVSYKRRRYDYH